MNWTCPTESEKEEMIRYIKGIRTFDVIMGIVVLIICLIPIAVGIFMLIDGNLYGISPIVIFTLVLLVPFGLFLSDLDRKKLIMEGDFTVCRCRVKSKNATHAGRYRTTYYISVLADDGKVRRFKSNSKMFFRAKEGSRAMLVNYPKKNEEDKGIPVDVIVYKDADME